MMRLVRLFAIPLTPFLVGCVIDQPIASAKPPRPHIIMVVTDDQELASVEFMPLLQEKLAYQGIRFENYFVTMAICCPSRVSMLRGQYPHNHGVWDKDDRAHGGVARFRDVGGDESTLATWLHSVGYRTVLLGKYLNGYTDSLIPPGWTDWYAAIERAPYYNYRLNENGRFVQYEDRAEDYETDMLGRKAVEIIRQAARRPRPLFMYLAPFAPHDPALPLPDTATSSISSLHFGHARSTRLM